MLAVARVLRLDQLETIPVAGVNWRPVRRTLGVTGFGINAYSGGPGQHLIEEHDEIGGGAGGHEELYVVLAGHARFTVDGEEIFYVSNPGLGLWAYEGRFGN